MTLATTTTIIAFALILQTTQTTQPIDRTTPRGAAMAMRVAIESGDEATLRDLMHSATDDARRMNDALVAVMAASSRLSIAANERFGTSNDPIASRAFAPVDYNVATTAPVEQKEDVATITLAGRDRPLLLHRGADGRWRFDLLAFTGAALDQQPDKQIEMYRDFARALNEVAADTRDGRFISVVDLKAAIQDRVHGAIAKSMRKPRPATTQSTTAPN